MIHLSNLTKTQMELETTKTKDMKNKNIKICLININGLNNKLDTVHKLIEDNKIDKYVYKKFSFR